MSFPARREAKLANPARAGNLVAKQRMGREIVDERRALLKREDRFHLPDERGKLNDRLHTPSITHWVIFSSITQPSGAPAD